MVTFRASMRGRALASQFVSGAQRERYLLGLLGLLGWIIPLVLKAGTSISP